MINAVVGIAVTAGLVLVAFLVAWVLSRREH